jgi:N-carbamoylputrescine amidase
MAQERLNWGIYRDRRPEMYGPLLSQDGRHLNARWHTSGDLA